MPGREQPDLVAHAAYDQVAAGDRRAQAPPLSREEQTRVFIQLPPHLARMALFKVNAGTREQEVIGLRWEWEVPVPVLETSAFILPEERVKNGEERLLVLNRVAMPVIEDVRGEQPDYVFTYRGLPVTVMNNSGWQGARKRAGLSMMQVHNLEHTFCLRLRAAGVSFEDRQDLLGHKSGRITTHYPAAELENLIEADISAGSAPRHLNVPQMRLGSVHSSGGSPIPGAPGPAGGTAYTDFLARLNGEVAGTSASEQLGGHSDWRLPTSAELQTILDCSFGGTIGTFPNIVNLPCIDPVFGPTAATFYWSSTTYTIDSTIAWQINFRNAVVTGVGKDFTKYVRAVRGGR